MATSYLSLMLAQTLDVSIPLMERLRLLRECSLRLATMGVEGVPMLHYRDQCYTQISDQLAQQDIHILSWDTLCDTDRQTLMVYWKHTVFPLLRPTVHTSDLRIAGTSGVAAHLNYQGQTFFGCVELPKTLPSVFFFPDKPIRFVFVESLLCTNAPMLFHGYRTEEVAFFHCRNNYLELSASISEAMDHALGESELPRVVLSAPTNWDYVDELERRLSPVQQERLSAARPVSKEKTLRNKMMLSHPGDSFNPLLQALGDHSVQTVFLAWNRAYQPPWLVPILQKLAKEGTHIALIPWEYSGLCWIQRKKYGTESVQTFFTTGNWDHRSGIHWTLVSDDSLLCRDAMRMLQSKCTGLRHPIHTELLLFPSAGKQQLLSELEREITVGSFGYIHWMVQDLCDPDLTAALVDAARAGVSVNIQMFGDCRFPEWVSGLHVRAILAPLPIDGQVFSFGSRERCRMYLSSPGESLLCPVTDSICRNQLQTSLDALRASARSWMLTRDGTWSPE